LRSIISASLIAVAALVPADQVDEYVRSQLALRRLPGVSVAVVRNGEIVKAAGYGVASLELPVPADQRTVYEIGSISKQIAANAVLLLVEDGQLRLDDPISKYLPAAPPSWPPTTDQAISRPDVWGMKFVRLRLSREGRLLGTLVEDFDPVTVLRQG
jgi:CubicO group peptidase (beta-lactamase class C family)